MWFRIIDRVDPQRVNEGINIAKNHPCTGSYVKPFHKITRSDASGELDGE